LHTAFLQGYRALRGDQSRVQRGGENGLSSRGEGALRIIRKTIGEFSVKIFKTELLRESSGEREGENLQKVFGEFVA